MNKTTNNLSNKLTLRDLHILAESMLGKKLNEPYRLVLDFDKRTRTKKERESYVSCYISSYYTNDICSIFLKPNVSKFTLSNLRNLSNISRSKEGTYFAVGKRSNLSVIFTVDTTDKDSKYPRSTYRVEFKDKESLLRGLQVYAVLATQTKDKILRRKLRAYFTYLGLL